MARKQALMVKQVVGNTNLSLQAKAGESLLIKDIMIYNPVSSYATLWVDKDTVGYYRVGGNAGNHLPLPIGSAGHSHSVIVAAADGALAQDHALSDAHGVSNAHIAVFSDRAALTTEPDIVQYGMIPHLDYKTILSFLGSTGIFKGYPVAEGETFLMTGVAQAGAIQIVVYEVHDAADILNTAENGGKSNKFMFINYGRQAAALVAAGSGLYSVSQTPAQFPNFPYGEKVPSKTKMTIYGILASDVVDYRSAADYMVTNYIKLLKGRETMFDDDKNGLILNGIIGTVGAGAEIARGVSLIGNYTDLDIKPPFMFPEALVLNEGEELNVYLTVAAGAAVAASTIPLVESEIGLIMTVEKLG